MQSERHCLPGGPGSGLIKKVRQHLWTYCRCKPMRNDRLWLNAWQWALNCRYDNGSGGRPGRWPMPTEIASQYLLLCLAEMRDSSALRLPHNAAQVLPMSVQKRLSGGQLPLLGHTE